VYFLDEFIRHFYKVIDGYAIQEVFDEWNSSITKWSMTWYLGEANAIVHVPLGPEGIGVIDDYIPYFVRSEVIDGYAIHVIHVIHT